MNCGFYLPQYWPIQCDQPGRLWCLSFLCVIDCASWGAFYKSTINSTIYMITTCRRNEISQHAADHSLKWQPVGEAVPNVLTNSQFIFIVQTSSTAILTYNILEYKSQIFQSNCQIKCKNESIFCSLNLPEPVNWVYWHSQHATLMKRPNGTISIIGSVE